MLGTNLDAGYTSVTKILPSGNLNAGRGERQIIEEDSKSTTRKTKQEVEPGVLKGKELQF